MTQIKQFIWVSNAAIFVCNELLIFLRAEMSTILDTSSQDIDSVVAAGGNDREYLELAKKGGGHKGKAMKGFMSNL